MRAPADASENGRLRMQSAPEARRQRRIQPSRNGNADHLYVANDAPGARRQRRRFRGNALARLATARFGTPQKALVGVLNADDEAIATARKSLSRFLHAGPRERIHAKARVRTVGRWRPSSWQCDRAALSALYAFLVAKARA
jgi:hypothetical protein